MNFIKLKMADFLLSSVNRGLRDDKDTVLTLSWYDVCATMYGGPCSVKNPCDVLKGVLITLYIIHSALFGTWMASWCTRVSPQRCTSVVPMCIRSKSANRDED